MKHLLAAIVVMLQFTLPVGAVQPDEILADPALETRARELSKDLRCLVCRNESIDESNAELARDLRILLRERLVAGDSDDQAMRYIVDRFGEYVLLNPKTTGSNLILWAAGPLMFLIALAVALRYVRRRSVATGEGATRREGRDTSDQLSDAEAAQLKAILERD